MIASFRLHLLVLVGILLYLWQFVYAQSVQGVDWPEDVDAIVIEEKSVFQVQALNKAVFKYRRFVQVMNEAGREEGVVKLAENQNRDVKNIEIRIYDVSGKELKKTDEDDIIETNIAPGVTLYSDTRYKYLELYWSHYPYIVELSYDIEYKSLYFWPGWYPQEDVPVLKSSYSIVLNYPVKFKTYPIGLDLEPRINGNIYSWELEDISPHDRESFMPPENRTQMAILFAAREFNYGNFPGSYDSWDEYARWYSRLLEDCYELTPDFRDEIQQIVENADSDREKLSRLYRCLQDNTRYVSIQLGIGGIQPNKAESVCRNKYGDCKDLSTLMVAMAREIGFEAHPVLVLTRDKGVVYQDFPSHQFNHAIAFVQLEDDSIWIECTADNLALGELGYSAEGCNVLIIKQDRGEMVRTPQSSADDNQMISFIDGELLHDGTLLFQGSLRSTGNINIWYRSGLIGESHDDQLTWLNNSILSRFIPQVKLETGEFKNVEEKVELPLESQFKGKIYKFGLRTGKRIFFNPAIIQRETADDIPDEAERKFPIYFYYPYMTLDSLVIKLPSGYELEAAPRIQDLETRFGHYRSFHSLAGNLLTYVRLMKINHKLIQPDDYGEYLAFVKAAVKNDNSKFVLRRKN
jgi:transglutaminase-like putative cysteine protease